MKRTVSKRTVRVADLRGLTNTETHTECVRHRLHLVHLPLHVIELGCEAGARVLETKKVVIKSRIHRDDTEGTAQ